MGTAARPTALVGLALIGTLVAAGCGADPTDPTGGDGPINPSPTGQGRLFIAWTTDGVHPSG